MPGGRGYGCCVSMGGAGTALMGLSAVTENDDGFCLNIYGDAKIKTERNGKKVALDIKASVYDGNGARIKIKSDGAEFVLRARIPSYAENFKVTINGENADYAIDKGYAVLCKVCDGIR